MVHTLSHDSPTLTIKRVLREKNAGNSVDGSLGSWRERMLFSLERTKERKFTGACVPGHIPNGSIGRCDTYQF